MKKAVHSLILVNMPDEIMIWKPLEYTQTNSVTVSALIQAFFCIVSSLNVLVLSRRNI